jgi:hypothetical protein
LGWVQELLSALFAYTFETPVFRPERPQRFTATGRLRFRGAAGAELALSLSAEQGNLADATVCAADPGNLFSYVV